MHFRIGDEEAKAISESVETAVETKGWHFPISGREISIRPGSPQKELAVR
jgi:hypothetical protein